MECYCRHCERMNPDTRMERDWEDPNKRIPVCDKCGLEVEVIDEL